MKCTINDFVGGAFTFQFTPKSQLDTLPPTTTAAFGPEAPVPLPVEKLAKAAEKPRYHMLRTIQTIPDLWREWTVSLQGQLSIEKLDELYNLD